MRKKKEPWEVYQEQAKKSRDRILGQTCTNCGNTLKENGVSAYPRLCKKCVN